MNTQKRFRISTTMAAAFATVVVLFQPVPVQAATCTVTSLADSGTGTLREKLADSNCDPITFGVTGTISLGGSLSIDRNLTITGPGASQLTVRAFARSFPVFVMTAGTVTISGLTINNGRGNIDKAAGDLTLTDSTLSGGAGRQDTSGPGAGGIVNRAGTLTVKKSTITGNLDSGITTIAGSSLAVEDTTFSGNTGDSGGAIQNNSDATATVTNSTFSGNSNLLNISGAEGGAIFNFGNITVTNSTFSGNRSDFGGGISNWNIATITNSTFSSNSGFGIASRSVGGSFPVKITLTNNVFANNVAPFPNTPGNCEISGIGGRSTDGVTSGGNLSSDVSYPGSLVADPLLGPLADNGGPTQTMSLFAGSPRSIR